MQKCADSDYPAHVQSIIRAFILRSYIYSSVSGQWRTWSDCADAQSDQVLRCPHLPEDTFSNGAAYGAATCMQYKWKTWKTYRNSTDFYLLWLARTAFCYWPEIEAFIISIKVRLKCPLCKGSWAHWLPLKTPRDRNQSYVRKLQNIVFKYLYKQYWAWSDTTELGVWSGSALFVTYVPGSDTLTDS